jgi:hypothetical protein
MYVTQNNYEEIAKTYKQKLIQKGKEKNRWLVFRVYCVFCISAKMYTQITMLVIWIHTMALTQNTHTTLQTNHQQDK